MSIKTIDVSRSSNSGVVITISGIPRTISNPQNIVCKEIYGIYGPTGVSQLYGIVCKTTDERFRLRITLEDTFSINGVVDLSQNPANWILLLNQMVFSGVTTFATPTKLAQTITFAQPAARVHTAPAFSANASTTSGLPLAYTSSDPTKATVGASTGIITPVAAGTTDITVSQAGDLNYAAATPIIRTITLT